MANNMADDGDGSDDVGDDLGGPPLEELPLSTDALLDILANSHRRYLLEFLRDQPDEAASFEQATKHLVTKVGREMGKQPNHDDVQVNLQHHHMPKMADAGVIDYDIRSQVIRYHGNEALEDLFDRVEEFQNDWDRI